MTVEFHGIRIKILPCVAGHLTTFDIGGSQIPRYAPGGGAVRGFILISALVAQMCLAAVGYLAWCCFGKSFDQNGTDSFKNVLSHFCCFNIFGSSC